ncbi:hypothetical protein HK101_004547, partial [Irineochytrium annulatum]
PSSVYGGSDHDSVGSGYRSNRSGRGSASAGSGYRTDRSNNNFNNLPIDGNSGLVTPLPGNISVFANPAIASFDNTTFNSQVLDEFLATSAQVNATVIGHMGSCNQQIMPELSGQHFKEALQLQLGNPAATTTGGSGNGLSVGAPTFVPGEKITRRPQEEDAATASLAMPGGMA